MGPMAEASWYWVSSRCSCAGLRAGKAARRLAQLICHKKLQVTGRAAHEGSREHSDRPCLLQGEPPGEAAGGGPGVQGESAPPATRAQDSRREALVGNLEVAVRPLLGSGKPPCP